jgi:hypothetical protein
MAAQRGAFGVHNRAGPTASWRSRTAMRFEAATSATTGMIDAGGKWKVAITMRALEGSRLVSEARSAALIDKLLAIFKRSRDALIDLLTSCVFGTANWRN